MWNLEILLESLIQNIWSWSLISPWNVFLLFQLLLKTPLSAQVCSQETSKTPYVLPSLLAPTMLIHFSQLPDPKLSIFTASLNCPSIIIHTGALFAVICIDITDFPTSNIYMYLLYTVLLNKDQKKKKKNTKAKQNKTLNRTALIK